MKKQLHGKIKELEKGKKYHILVNMGWDEKTKKYPRKTRIFYGTYRQAEAFLRNWIFELENPEEIKSRETVSEWLDNWIDNDARILYKWEQNTEKRARGIVDFNLKPHIGDILLVDLSPDDVMNLYAKLGKDGSRNNRPLSPRSLRYVHTILNQALIQAVKRRKIPSNPAHGLAPAQSKVQPKDKWVVLGKKELSDFLKAVKDEPDYPLIYTAAYTGARQSELLGLTWDKVNTKEKYIRIEQALHRDSNSEDGFELRLRTKNRTSTRNVDISDRVINVLNLHKEMQKSKGISVEPSSLVFTEPDGKPIEKERLIKRFNKHARDKGYEGMTFHHLRHTHATILLSEGEYINDVSERLGHADPGVTLRIYGHVLPDRRRRLSNRFDELIDE